MSDKSEVSIKEALNSKVFDVSIGGKNIGHITAAGEFHRSDDFPFKMAGSNLMAIGVKCAAVCEAFKGLAP